MADFSPLDALTRTLKSWWILVGMALLGAVAGWLFHRAQPPVYQATVGFTVNVDYALTGPLSERDVDNVLGSVGAFLISPRVVDEVVAQAQAQGLTIDTEGLRAMAIPERRLSLWQFHLRSEDPALAFELARLWGEVGLSHLIEAHGHAVQARALQLYIGFLGACVPYPEPPTAEFQSCRIPAGSTVLEEAAAATVLLEQERAVSGGLVGVMVFDQVQEPEMPAEPVLFGRGTLVFAGAMVGFLLGVVGTSVRWGRGSDTHRLLNRRDVWDGKQDA